MFTFYKSHFTIWKFFFKSEVEVAQDKDNQWCWIPKEGQQEPASELPLVPFGELPSHRQREHKTATALLFPYDFVQIHTCYFTELPVARDGEL